MTSNVPNGAAADAIDHQKRTFLQLAAGVLVSMSAACAKPCPPLALPSPGGRAVVDAHCHAFNAADLSPVRFIRYAHLQMYPEVADDRPVSEVHAPDLLDLAIQSILHLVGSDTAPSADQEIRLLRGQALRDAAEDEEEARAQTVDRLSAYLDERAEVEWSDPTAPTESRARALIQDAVFELGLRGEQAPVSGALDSETRRRVAANFLQAVESGEVPVAARPIDVPQMFRWVQLFRKYRHCLVDDLTLRHRSAGWNPVLIAPAMVDYGYWLEEQPTSSLSDQVDVWSRISARPAGPPVHGYVAYDPLRQVLYREGRVREPEAPIALVERALEERGFLGVKLYPPMGFSAVQNAERDFSQIPFPLEVLRRRFGATPSRDEASLSRILGAELDAALEELYALCERLDAPILAHGGPGNSITPGSGRLSDPWRWSELFEHRRPTRPLRVLLAHYARFEDRSEDPSAPVSDPAHLAYENTFEAAFLRLLGRPGSDFVAVDLSMLTHAVALRGRDRELLLENLRRFLPVAKDRLIFGTDWTMLGIQRGEERYDPAVAQLLSDAGLNDRDFRAVQCDNFLRIAGLRPGEATRRRLDAFHEAAGQPGRLHVLDG